MQVGCLMVLFCKEYNVEASKVLEDIVSGDTASVTDVPIEVTVKCCDNKL